jgi:hypothetical protein
MTATPKPITSPAVLLFRGKGVISTLIRWQTRGEYSHAALLMPDGMIVESWQGAGVRVTSLSDWSHIDRLSIPNARWFCSELVFAALAHAGVHLFARIEPWAVSPGLLAISPLLSPAHD